MSVLWWTALAATLVLGGIYAISARRAERIRANRQPLHLTAPPRKSRLQTGIF